MSTVLGALNGFVAAGLWRDRRVRAAGYGPALIKRGAVYVYSVRFEARRALPEAAMTAEQAGDGQDLTELGADVNLEGTADDPENPQNVLGITYL